VVPGGSGGRIPGNGGCAGLAFWRFFSGRGLEPFTVTDEEFSAFPSGVAGAASHFPAVEIVLR
jgi:hypothetical protein